MNRRMMRSLALVGALTIGGLGLSSAAFAAENMPAPKVTLAGQAATIDVSQLDIKGIRYAWNFGDGAFDLAGAVVTHTYTQPGSYVVTVNIVDADGQETAVTLVVNFSDRDRYVIDADGDPIEASSSAVGETPANFTSGEPTSPLAPAPAPATPQQPAEEAQPTRG